MKAIKESNRFSQEIQRASERKGNGVLERIWLVAGTPNQFDVHIWPSSGPEDSALRRGVAYARSSLYLEDNFLVTPQDANMLSQCVSLYNRMRAGIHACLTEHGVTNRAGEIFLNQSAQVTMYHFGNMAFETHDWENFARRVDEQVRKLGGTTVLPQDWIAACDDSAARAARETFLNRMDAIGLGKFNMRSNHLSVVKHPPAANPA